MSTAAISTRRFLAIARQPCLTPLEKLKKWQAFVLCGSHVCYIGELICAQLYRMYLRAHDLCWHLAKRFPIRTSSLKPRCPSWAPSMLRTSCTWHCSIKVCLFRLTELYPVLTNIDATTLHCLTQRRLRLRTATNCNCLLQCVGTTFHFLVCEYVDAAAFALICSSPFSMRMLTTVIRCTFACPVIWFLQVLCSYSLLSSDLSL